MRRPLGPGSPLRCGRDDEKREGGEESLDHPPGSRPRRAYIDRDPSQELPCPTSRPSRSPAAGPPPIPTASSSIRCPRPTA
ncbi:hypothetical protein DMC25_01455 [Caulobacter sp. D4A]|nr:hypothetical protein DMC18_23350 [Caulobacter sp. D5]PXA94978.1 hypothetical protein DMC25_01455 [Caulobacter sp. D4A]